MPDIKPSLKWAAACHGINNICILLTRVMEQMASANNAMRSTGMEGKCKGRQECA